MLLVIMIYFSDISWDEVQHII